MSIDNKVLKIAGKDQFDYVKGIKVRQDGEIVASDGSKILKVTKGTLLANTSTDELYTLTEGRPCRVFAFIENSTGNPWQLQVTAKVLDTEQTFGGSYEDRNSFYPFDSSMNRTNTVTSSGSENLVVGNGGRASGWTGLIEHFVTGFYYKLSNNSSSELNYTLVVVSYPYEALVDDRLKVVQKTLDDIKNSNMKERSEVVSANATLTSPELTVLYDSDSYTRMEVLDISSTSTVDPIVRIFPKNADGSLQASIGIGNGLNGKGARLSFKDVAAYNNKLFEVAHSDENATVISLSRYLVFPHGVQIAVQTEKLNIDCGIRGYFVRGE